MDRATVYGDDPAAQARLFAQAGASHLHVVDLDGSFAGSAQNREAVESIVAAFPGKVQLGGGIRTPADVEGWLEAGVERIVIGTAALKDPQFVKAMARAHAGRIVVAVDARDGMVATDGWAEVSGRVDRRHGAALRGRRGRQPAVHRHRPRRLAQGGEHRCHRGLARQVDIPVIASGGVKGLIDINTLMQFAGDGIEGVITGRALYDGRLDLTAALRVAGGI